MLNFTNHVCRPENTGIHPQKVNSIDRKFFGSLDSNPSLSPGRGALAVGAHTLTYMARMECSRTHQTFSRLWLQVLSLRFLVHFGTGPH